MAICTYLLARQQYACQKAPVSAWQHPRITTTYLLADVCAPLPDDYLVGPSEYLVGPDEYLVGPDEYLVGPDEYLVGPNEYLANLRAESAPSTQIGVVVVRGYEVVVMGYEVIVGPYEVVVMGYEVIVN